MSVLGDVVALGVITLVFGLSVVVWFMLIAGLGYAGIRKLRDLVQGWRDLTCPATRKQVEVQVNTVRGRQLAVLSCSRFGHRPPKCGQMCLVDVAPAA